MVDTFTLHSLVRYVYTECSFEEKQVIEEIACEDSEINSELADLKKAKQYLPKVSFYPKDKTLNNLLNYSKF